MASYNNQMQTFRLRDIVLFKKNKGGNLCQWWWNAKNREIMEAYGAMMRLVNHKSGHINSWINHETNGEPYLNPVRELGFQYIHLRNTKVKMDLLMSAFF